MKCAACGQPTFTLTKTRDICAKCSGKLPAQTRHAYRDGEITTRQAVDALRTRTASVKTFGGGRSNR